ncbi:MAG: peptide chain release factor N(5)-glutamine methyltransferase [Pseudomonadota bacterium]
MQSTIEQALKAVQTAASGQPIDRLDAQLLLLHTLGKNQTDRAWLLAHDDDVLSPASLARFQQLSQRRARGEPLAYIVGYKEFFGLNLMVDARVLVPRPDTETLVQWSLDVLDQLYQGAAPAFKPQILDLGTGSGAVAIALAHKLKMAGRMATVSALDASVDALAVAAENAQLLQLDIGFAKSHWFEQVSSQHHVIVSNPPYIANADPHLLALVHEPLAALTAGDDGLDDIRQIINDAPRHLHQGGWLLLEHGHDQADRVCALLKQGGFEQVQHRLDLAGIRRCSGGRWPN